MIPFFIAGQRRTKTTRNETSERRGRPLQKIREAKRRRGTANARRNQSKSPGS